MIVVGGWPGRNVVGLNGRFGVRPAAFGTAGLENPFVNDVDAGDDTTEFVAVVSALPASGTVTFDDDGSFSHTGAVDGSYVTTFTLYTWAQGGPVTQHATAELISTLIGAYSVTLTGIPSGEAFGTVQVTTEAITSVTLSGVPSSEAFGTLVVTTSANAVTDVNLTGIASSEAFGQLVVTSSAGSITDVTLLGVPSEEVFGQLVVTTVADTGSSDPLSDAEMRQMYRWVQELALINGLVSGQPVTVQRTSRKVGAIEQSITGAGGSTVVVERV